MERRMVAIWQRALHVDEIGIHDNFFDLGGHSLLLLKVHSQLQETFLKEIPVLELFKYPTISALAASLTAAAAPEPEPDPATSARAEARREVRAQQRQLSLRRRTGFRQKPGADPDPERSDDE
jgi:acyl carrier protein